jgi:hypothetical protein
MAVEGGPRKASRRRVRLAEWWWWVGPVLTGFRNQKLSTAGPRQPGLSPPHSESPPNLSQGVFLVSRETSHSCTSRAVLCACCPASGMDFLEVA